MPFADAWGDVDELAQDQYNIEACAIITRMAWDGIATFSHQSLAFPRAWLCRPDGYAIASNLIPEWLKDGAARLAFWLSQQDGSPYNGNGLEPRTELTLASGMRLTPASRPSIPSDVRDLFRPYVRSGRTTVRG
jgi:hypothetical protein